MTLIERLDPAIRARVDELVSQGVRRGDAIGRAQWERDHADDPNPYWTDEDDS